MMRLMYDKIRTALRFLGVDSRVAAALYIVEKGLDANVRIKAPVHCLFRC